MTPRIVLTLVSLAVLLAALSVHRLQCADVEGPYVPFSGHTMGTTWEVKVARADLSPDDMREIGTAIDAALERVDAALSTWREDSELSRFNARRSTEPFAIGDETATVLRTADSVSRASGGAFDVTVGPLVEAWGFGRGDVEAPTPTPQETASLRERIGFEKLDLEDAGPALSKRDPDLEVDVSAIAKGHGVDAVAGALAGLGHDAYLVEIGGELCARGVRLDGAPFRVAIEAPDVSIRRIHLVIELRDVCMATSGDYRSWREVDGTRVSHTIDPRTGRPITHALASVTVLHESAMWADAWATALNVLGPEKGLALAEEQGLPAYFIVRTGEGAFETRATAAFVPLLPRDDATAAASK